MASKDSSARARQRRIVIASALIGATIEWYDFFIFGVLSALYLNKLFFPTFDPTIATILSFMAFATAWLVRPLGGVIAGHLGDKNFGRKTTLLWSFMIMGLATTLIGLLPTYETAGATGAILLVLLRIIQGLSVGGEFGGAIVTVVEHADKSKRGLYGSLVQCGAILGLLLGNATFFLMIHFDSHSTMMAWGWRVPFLLSIVMLGVGTLIRSKVMESPEFLEEKQKGTIEKAPLLAVIRQHPRQLLSIMFAQAAPNTFFYAAAVAMVSYAVTKTGISQPRMLAAVCIGAIVELCTIPLFGVLADRISRRKVYVGGLIVMGLSSYPFFVFIQTHAYGWLLVCYAVMLGIGHSACQSSQASLFTDMFPTNVRYTGLSLGYQMSGAVFGGPLPVIATLLIAAQGGGVWLFYGYTILIAIVSVIAIMCGKPYPTTQQHQPLAPAVSRA